MLYNKNNVRKTNDKKILHKVGKQWKVVSVALLMAIGGGAAVAATNNNANAQSTNGANVSVQSEAANLENDNYAAPKSASANTSSKASSTSAKAPSLANVSYAPSARVDGNNASAASYHNQDEFDKAEINFYGPTVKSYVNSINARFPAAAHNLQSNYNAASMSASNDASLANSYSVAANNKDNASVVSELAAKSGYTASAFVDTVKYYAPSYANSVKSASAETNAMSLAYSLVNEVSGMSAQAPELLANARVNSAIDSAAYSNANTIAAVAQRAANEAVYTSTANDKALVNATVASIEASGAAKVALANSGADANIVNSFAQANSLTNGRVKANWNSSAVSSAVSYAADHFNASAENVPVSYSDFNFASQNSNSNADFSAVSSAVSANDTSYLNSSANSANIAMYQVVSDTAAMSSAAYTTSFANSVIASARAAKSGYTANVTATSLSAKNATNDINSLSNKSDASRVEAQIFGVLGANSSAAVSAGEKVLNDIDAGYGLENTAKAVFGLSGESDKNGVYDLAEASGVDVNAMKNNASGISKVAHGIANGYRNAMKSANNNDIAKLSALTSAMSSEATTTENDYTSAVSASNSYSNATDESVTLASIYATSYSNDAKSEASVASDAAKDLNNFYTANADATFASADAAFEAAKKAEPNDATLAHAFGVNVLHNSPQFITLTANAMLHSAANYTAKNGVKAVKAGESFAVKGVAFDEAGNIRYVVGESDNNPVYLTGNDGYVENTYLEPDNQYTVKFTKDANAHKGLNFDSKVVGSVKAGQTVTANAVATVSVNSYDHYFGVARLQLANGSYVTANKSYFTVINNNNNNNNDNSESNKANNNFARDLVLFK